MNLIYNPVFLTHDTSMHPENKKRLEAFLNMPPTPVPDGSEYLELVHDPAYIKRVKDHCERGDPHIGPETVVSAQSYEAAVRAVGATIMASQQQDMALVRPPGHHAHTDQATGFCIFNNVAIAAQYWVEQGKRVLILDIDGHLGDGTSAIFYQTDQVMYWTLHQYPAFPGHGLFNEIGDGKGRGYTVSIPVPPRAGDDIIMHAFNEFMPVAEQFKPDIVAVSAGFDSHQYDLLLDLRASVSSFYEMGKDIARRFRNIPIFATLEGGYNVEELPKCVLNFQAGINGAPRPYHEPTTESDLRVWQTYELYLHGAIGQLSPYWKF